jgi:uncharacterized membrane protein
LNKETKQMNRMDKASLTLIAASLAGGLAAYSHLPAQVATHWNLQGEVNGYQPRLVAALFAPLLGLVIYIAKRSFLPWWSKRQASGAGSAPMAATTLLTIALLAGVHALVLLGALGVAIDHVRVTACALSLFAVGMGLVLPRVRPNPLVGIRNFWTYASPEVWARTHRFAGYVFVAAGVLMLPLVAAGSKLACAVAIGTFAAASAVASAYSWYIARNMRA